MNSAVTKPVKNFSSTKLTQTGYLPALNISADKATYKHHTREFLSCATVDPGADELIRVIGFGQPIVTAHKGFDIAKNFKEELDRFNVQPRQLEGGSFDGQYFHFNVHTSLKSLYNHQPTATLWAWDAMHKRGLVDIHLCKVSGGISNMENAFKTFKTFFRNQIRQQL